MAYVFNEPGGIHKTRHQEGLAASIGVSPYNVSHALNDGFSMAYDLRPCRSVKLTV